MVQGKLGAAIEKLGKACVLGEKCSKRSYVCVGKTSNCTQTKNS